MRALPERSNAHLQGRTLAEAAALRGQSVDNALCDLLIEEKLDIDAIFFCMSEDNLRTILRQGWVMVGSDAAVRDTDGLLAATCRTRGRLAPARVFWKWCVMRN